MAFPKKKKEIKPWRQGILEHHKSKPSSADRGEFPPNVVKTLKAEANGLCQSCRAAPDTTTHHVMPRGRRTSPGRGVKTNGLRLCGPCHDRIQTHEEELQQWVNFYSIKFGPRFWYDEQDWQEYERKQAEEKAREEERQQRREQIQPIINLLKAGLGRKLKKSEQRFLDGLNEHQREMFAGLLHDLTGTYVRNMPDPTFGYGRFND